MLLLLLLLQASLVHRSLQGGPPLDNDELFANFKEFPAGSLLTIYFKSVPAQPQSSVSIDLYEDFSKQHNRLHFRIDPDRAAPIVSNVAAPDFKKETEQSPVTYASPSKEDLKRFDLYKLNDTHFIPFFQGFSAGIRTMVGVAKPTSVHMKSHVPNLNPLNFDKNDVYLTFRSPVHAPEDIETVLNALDQATVGKNRTKEKYFTGNFDFPVGKKMKMSVLMLSHPWDKKDVPGDMDNNFATLYFNGDTNHWAFGLCNKWDEADKIVKLHLFAGPTWLLKEDIGPNPVECGKGSTTSTDIIHLKLERLDRKIIKVRVYYRGSAGGITCQIDVGDEGADFLDRKISISGVQSGTVLHYNGPY